MSRVRHPCLGFFLGLGLLLCAVPAQTLAAGGKSGASGRAGQGGNQQAERLLKQAQASIAAKDFDGACKALKQAYPLSPGLSLYYLAQVALAEQKQAEARDLFRRFLADSGVDNASPQRVFAQQQLDSLPVVESGEVSVGAPRGTNIELDGRFVGTVPLSSPLFIKTGPHRITVNQGRWTAETELLVRASRLAEVRFKAGSDVAVVTLPSAVLYCETYSPSSEQAKPPDAAVSEQITVAVEAAMKRENYALLSQKAALANARDVAACKNPADPQCCIELARRYGMDYVFDVRMSGSGRTGDDWRLAASLRDVQMEDIAASASPGCAECTPDKAATRLAELATQLLGQAATRARGTLEVTSKPLGAEVFLEGRRLGVTPLSRPVWAGSYRLEVRKPEYVAQEQNIEVTSENPAHIELALSAEKPVVVVPPPVPVLPKRPVWRLVAGAAGIGAGVILLGFGAAALAQNGVCAVDMIPAGQMCPRIYNTQVPGAAMVSVGVVLAVAGGVVIALPPKKSQ